MKKKTLLTSLLTIVMCLALIAGSTYALFTSEDEINIAVTSGKVNVEATILTDTLATSSLGVAQTDGAFANGGSALFTDGDVETLTLTNMTPGDAVSFKIKLVNTSNIDILYRLTWAVEGNLYEHLVAEADGVAIENNVTDWTEWDAPADGSDEKEISVTVTLPAEVGNVAQEKNATISFKIEAVQGNAVVENVSNADQLWAALEMGVKEITLVEDITLANGQVITVAEGATATINLNGKTITGTSHKSVGAVIKNNGTLTITGGTISSTAANGGSAIANSGTLIVNNATLNGASNADGSWPAYTVNNTGVMTINNTTITSVHGAVASYGEGAVLTLNNTNIDMKGIPGFTNHGIYTYDNGKVIVNGGNIANKATDQSATGGSVINGNVIVNSGNFTGRIENYYGTPAIYGGTFSVTPSRFVAEGYVAKETSTGTWVVLKGTVDSTTVVNGNDTLKNAVKDNTTIYLEEGNYSLPTLSGKTGVTIEAAPGTVIGGENTSTGFGGNFGKDTTIKNLSFEGSSNGVRWSYANGGTTVFENCTFAGDSTYGFHIDESNGATFIFKNCTFSGFNAFAGDLVSVTFENCTFLHNGNYGHINIWSVAYFNNCTFGEGVTYGGEIYIDGVLAD